MLTFPTLIYIVFGVILWRPFVIDAFKIDAKIKSRTLLVAALAGIMGMIIAYAGLDLMPRP